MYYEMAQSLSHEYEVAREQLSPVLVEFLTKGRAMSQDTYLEALAIRDQGKQEIASLFNDVDVMIAPSTLGEAPEGLSATGNPVMSRLWTLLGNPTIHLPIGYSLKKLPLGLTVVGALKEDKTLLSAAHHLENLFSGS